MKKETLSSILVVEGKTDKQFLLSFLNAHIVETNGSAISKEILRELQLLSQKHPILVITDPDFPGEQIRNKIMHAIPEAQHLYLEKAYCVEKGKVGLAQCSQDYLLKRLKDKVVFDRSSQPSWNDLDLFDLKLIGNENSQSLRQRLCQHLNIAPCNGKQLLQKLNWLQIKKELVKEYIQSYG